MVRLEDSTHPTLDAGYLLTKTLLSVALLGLSVLMPGCSEPTQSEIKTTKHRARQLIEALEAYEHDHDRYPENLNTLTPKYLRDIPEPAIGNEWSYYNRGAYYDLEFHADPTSGPFWLYRSKGGKWHYDSGEF
jgi:hypothetical protein